MDLSLKLQQRLKAFLCSRYCLYLVLLVFTLQALYFVAAVGFQIPPDEDYHFGLTTYYAQQSWLGGPFIADQPRDWLWLGDIERTPNYLYSYLLSFPLRLMVLTGFQMEWQVLGLRLISVGLGAMSLVVFYRLLRRLGSDRLMANAATAALSITGMFVWTFAAINYDTMAILLFFCFLLFAVSTLQTKRFDYLAGASLSGLALLITKYVYAPEIAAGLAALVVVLGLYWRGKIGILTGWLKQLTWGGRLYVGLLLMGNLAFGGLALERYGFNLFVYQDVSPKCSQLHQPSACIAESSVAQRNYEQQQRYEHIIARGEAKVYQPLAFSSDWLRVMYERLYFYYGRMTIFPGAVSRLVGKVFLAVLLLLALNKGWRGFCGSKERCLVAGLSGLYLVLLYGRNLHTYLSLGEMFAWQGRYLLPIIGFIYAGLFAAAGQGWRRLPRRLSIGLAVPLAALVLVVTALYLPVSIFWRQADASWYVDVIYAH